MKYLNTRDVYLSTINEDIGGTPHHEITFGASLLGRLVNSALRWAKVGINYNKIDSIAAAIQMKLNELLKQTLDEDQQKQIDAIIASYLLVEIHNCVTSAVTDEEKISELLDKNDSPGLVNTAISYIKKLSDDAIFNNNDNSVNKGDLVEKLEKFRDELLRLKPSKDENFYKNTKNLLKAVITIDDLIRNKKINLDTNGNKEEPKDDYYLEPQEKDEPKEEGEKEYYINPEEKEKVPYKYTVAPKAKVENIENFWSFFQKFNETDVPTNAPAVTPGNIPSNTNFSSSKSDNQVSTKKSANEVALVKIYSAYGSSQLGKFISIYKDLVNSNNNKEIVAFGKQIMTNRLTVGKQISYEQLVKEDLTFDSPAKALSLFSRVILPLKDKDIQFGTATESFSLFIESYYNMVSDYESLNENYIFEDTITNNEEPTNVKSQEEAESTETETNDSKVSSAWSEYFQPEEEKAWVYDPAKANKLKRDLANSFDSGGDIDMKDDNSRDAIIQIANLFEKAYRLYVTELIPSKRPGGRISDKTYSEYIFLGGGITPGNHSEKGPGPGPWANKYVFNKFKDKITSFIELKRYRRIFNFGTIKTTSGKSVKGNVLLEFIRNMIDERTLKSFDESRTKLLNKYFELRPNDLDKATDTNNMQSNIIGDSVKSKGEIFWKDIASIETPPENGTFIALNCNYSMKKSQKDDTLVAKHDVIIGQVLSSEENKVLIQFQFSNEYIPTHYNEITASKLYYNKPGGDIKPTLVGLIDLSKDKIAKDRKFLMVYQETKLINKTDTPHKVHFTPVEKNINSPSGVARATTIKRRPVAVLIKREDGKDEVLSNQTKILGNIPLEIDEAFDKLNNFID